MKQKLKLVLTLAFIIFVFDHLTKAWIVANVPMGTGFTVIDGFFDIVHGRNTGAAFGFLADWDSPFRNLFFYGIGILAAGFLYNFTKSLPETDKRSLTAIGLILGGALGNLTDRFFRGSVVDFLSVHYHNSVKTLELFGSEFIIPLTWPAFNVADSAISVAIVLLLLENFSTRSDTVLKDQKEHL
jgi:signal peptidase II